MSYLHKPLDPQPWGGLQHSFLDCCENDDGTEFNFYEGNEMEGHDLVFGPVYLPEKGLAPKLNWKTGIWTWEKRERETTREWLIRQPWYKKGVHD